MGKNPTQRTVSELNGFMLGLYRSDELKGTMNSYNKLSPYFLTPMTAVFRNLDEKSNIRQFIAMKSFDFVV